MAKRKDRTEPMKELMADGIKLAELAQSNEYQRYLKEHARKMRRLQREASGMNMVEPE